MEQGTLSSTQSSAMRRLVAIYDHVTFFFLFLLTHFQTIESTCM